MHKSGYTFWRFECSCSVSKSYPENNNLLQLLTPLWEPSKVIDRSLIKGNTVDPRQLVPLLPSFRPSRPYTGQDLLSHLLRGSVFFSGTYSLAFILEKVFYTVFDIPLFRQIVFCRYNGTFNYSDIPWSVLIPKHHYSHKFCFFGRILGHLTLIFSWRIFIPIPNYSDRLSINLRAAYLKDNYIHSRNITKISLFNT